MRGLSIFGVQEVVELPRGGFGDPLDLRELVRGRGADGLDSLEVPEDLRRAFFADPLALGELSLIHIYMCIRDSTS